MNLIELGSVNTMSFFPRASSSSWIGLPRLVSIGGISCLYASSYWAQQQQLNPDYVQQSNACLASLGLTETEFRQLLCQLHEKMRIEATKQQAFGNSVSYR
jgi:hypothetical protein